MKKLDKVTNGVFKAALAFYRLERGKGKKAKDISTFFLLTKLDQRFDTYWHSPKNKFREEVKRALRDFEEAIEEFELLE